MLHYVLTRAAYGPRWDIDANRRRLAITAGVTVRGMAAQTLRDWTWIIALDRADQLGAERRAVFAAAGVPVLFVEVGSGDSVHSKAAMDAYRAPWRSVMEPGPVLTTRIDDDDAFAPDALARVRKTAERAKRPGRTVWMLPNGIRTFAGRYVPVTHDSNAFATLQVDDGDEAVVYDYLHRDVRAFAKVVKVDTRPGWLWLRHPDTLSGHKTALLPLDTQTRATFPVDWRLIASIQPPTKPIRGVVRFR